MNLDGELDELIDSTGNPFTDKILQIGLFIGAIFQLCCIFAIIFMPDTSISKTTSANEAEDKKTYDKQQPVPLSNAAPLRQSYSKKPEKKKRK